MLLETPTQPRPPAQMAGVLELVCRRSRAPVIGVAGSSGKSTTLQLIVDMLRTSHYGVVVGVREAVERLDMLGRGERVVVEMTDAAHGPRVGPDVLVITSLAPDQLPPGQTGEAAQAALRPTVERTGTAVVANADETASLAVAMCAKSTLMLASTKDPSADASVVDGALVVRSPVDGTPHGVCRVDDIALRGSALLSNVLVAAAAGMAAGARVEAIRQAVRRAEPGPDCQELVSVRGGVRWVCDARGTRPGRSVAALDAQTGPVMLVAGGASGGQPLDGWAAAAGAAASHVLLFGPAGDPMAAALQNPAARAPIIRCADLDDAVLTAARIARRGDTVLFSPGCEPHSRARPSPSERFRDLSSMPRSARAEAA